MGLERVYYVGDSLSVQMSKSLYKLLGHDDDPVLGKPYNWSRQVQCPNPEQNFEISFTRNDHLAKTDETNLVPDASLPWIKPYLE
eukprot:CAMPEP_0194055606 /NCGR_PEP_ID=MMETSP0009_2-20130614/57292_1 /TAXON_ID=210454 /ORGANISM="Grammatophora oceanica, Strain CCMP 410" /LENGTH=84 /DNA_ID=CAMNT_0038704575 /DNA_START=35 /DNA_END=286 /DNA_ORIENTATION=-